MDVSKYKLFEFYCFIGIRSHNIYCKEQLASYYYLKQNYKIEHQLVLIGQTGWKYQPILDTINQSPYRAEIHHLNYVTDDLVALFYTQAEAFIYPSFYEGFGMPPLEAMACGLPVITSDNSSLPEVVGKSGILVDAHNLAEITDKIRYLIDNPKVRERLSAKGIIRASQFSWDDSALQMKKLIKEISS